MGFWELSSGLANWVLGESALGWCLGGLSCCVILGLFLALSGPHFRFHDSIRSEMGPTSRPAPRVVEENASLERS